jgi:hypothetical protein
MVLFNKLEIHRNDIHVQNLCNNVDELLESCNIKSYLYKGQDNLTNFMGHNLAIIVR